MTQMGATIPSLLLCHPQSSYHQAHECLMALSSTSLGPMLPCIPGLVGIGPYVSGPGHLTSETIATDINGLQLCHLHNVDATVGKTGNTLWTDGLHGYHIGGNKG